MKRITLLLVGVATLAGVVALKARAPRHANQEDTPAFVTEIPAGYPDWRFISVAHEEGNPNSFASIFGQRHRDQGLPGWQASISGWRHHCRIKLPLRSVWGKQQSIWP